MANQAQIRKSLQRPYDLQLFAKDVLNPVFGENLEMRSETITATIEPTETERKSINKVFIYAKINLDDGTELICYEIELQKNIRIEQNKITIQHYVRKLLTAGQSALINFVNPDNKNLWRLTFIAKAGTITEKGIEEKQTNAKRYTYLLGSHESCKTVAERFEILSNETSLTIETITNAFSVEKLSKAFFDEYLLHYNRFVEYLTKSNFRQSVFSADDKAIRDFTKKLLGRIVFLYFVQKKGWLGASDLEYKDGLQNFIMQFYELAGADETFYNNYLKILFFETLNKEREEDNFEMPDGKTVKIPFLNGGLFDKEKFDDKILTFKPNLFHNITNEEDPKYRGFLDFLNAYNFTIYEDSPDEQIVAVDPEMLGHIFENLLEDNKDKGAYYTPKEIVHYMCQESLTEYLKTNLIDFENQSDLNQLVKQKEINDLSNKQLQQVDNLLDNVKVCDPAIGSGAFPMGLLQEIYNLKEIIAYQTNAEWKPAEVKENIIQNSIYGVDIEKGAVDIARLRFWLSLIIDVEKPKPLPNLDYKIVIGNSLISKFENEVIEIDWKLTQNTALKQSRPDLFKRINENIKNIYEAQNNFFHSVADKNKLKLKIRNLKIELLETLIKIEKQKLIESGLDPQSATKKNEIVKITERKIKYEGFNKMLSKLQTLKTQPEKPLNYFDWQLNFPEVLNPAYANDNYKSSSQIEITNSQIVALNKQIDAINLHLKQHDIDIHIINLQTDIAKSQITLVKEQLQKIEKRISDIYGELFSVEKNVVKEPDLSFTYYIKGINKGISEINKKVKSLNPKLSKSEVYDSLGFDIVIGNPPYVKVQNIEKSLIKFLKNKYYSTTNKFDLYVVFIELAFNIIHKKGIASYINPHRFIRAEYGQGIKNILVKNKGLKKIINFGTDQVFENVTTYSGIFFFSYDNQNILYGKCYNQHLNIINFTNIPFVNIYENWLLTTNKNIVSIFAKINTNSYRLDELMKGIYQGLVTVGDDIYILKGEVIGDVFKGYSKKLNQEIEIESKILKPVLKGENIVRYEKPKTELYCIYPHYVNEKGKTKPFEEEFFKQQFPLTYEYMLNFKDYLIQKKKTYKTNPKYWFTLHRSRDLNIFQQEKIITPQLQNKPSFTFDYENYFPDAGGYILIKNQTINYPVLFYLAVLNSKLLYFFIKNTSTPYSGDYYYFKTKYLQVFRIPKTIDKLLLNKFKDKVSNILNLKKQDKDSSDLEAEIDAMVYKLYGLTEEEIQIVEESIKQ